MRTQLFFALPLLVLGCDTGATGPLGPSGGVNKFSVTIAEEKEPFDEVDLEIRPTTAGIISFDLTGSVDPLKDAIDDEYALHLSLELDKAALIAMSAPGELKVRGTAAFEPSDEAGSRETVTYQNDPASSPIVKSLFFRRSCFCANQDSGEQTFDGTMMVEKVSASEITGTLTIRLEGDVPNYTGKLDATLTAAFNLAIP